VAHNCGDNVCTNFTRGTPYKTWEGKNVQSSARFLTTFDFDRKYLRNGSTYRKSEKYLINYISSPIGRKNGELWSTKQKVIGAHVDPPNWTFTETIFQPLGGAGPSNFTRPTSPINCISSRTWGARRPQVGLCPIFLVFLSSAILISAISVVSILTLILKYPLPSLPLSFTPN